VTSSNFQQLLSDANLHIELPNGTRNVEGDWFGDSYLISITTENANVKISESGDHSSRICDVHAITDYLQSIKEWQSVQVIKREQNNKTRTFLIQSSVANLHSGASSAKIRYFVWSCLVDRPVICTSDRAKLKETAMHVWDICSTLRGSLD